MVLIHLGKLPQTVEAPAEELLFGEDGGIGKREVFLRWRENIDAMGVGRERSLRSGNGVGGFDDGFGGGGGSRELVRVRRRRRRREKLLTKLGRGSHGRRNERKWRRDRAIARSRGRRGWRLAVFESGFF